MAWRITKWDGDKELSNWKVSGRLGERQICRLLERLVCQTLSEREIIEAADGKSSLLSRTGTGTPITYGTNPFFTAERV